MRRFALVLALASCTSTPPTGTDPSTEGSSESSSSSSSGGAVDTSTSGLDGTSEGSSSDATSTTTGPDGAAYDERGPWGVGVSTRELPGADGRTVRVTVWYPTDVADGQVGLEELVAAENVAAFEGLLGDAPPDCTRPTIEATLDAPLAAGPFPLVMFSHCLSCLGFSSTSVAERMASHGLVVAGVTHTGDTLFDAIEGVIAPLSGEWLAVRAADVGLVLDGLLASADVAPIVDASRLGVFGHSYGAATTGLVLQEDARFSAGVALAAPVENPLLPGVSVAAIEEPMLLLVAQEDNSITEIGNNLMRSNAMELPGGSWLVELRDAGHWSVSDLCGIIDAFEPGCGDGIRQTVPGEPFTYLDNALARDITATYVTAFFAWHLLGDADAEAVLDTPEPADVVTIERYPPS